jgi:hypothetical protein
MDDGWFWLGVAFVGGMVAQRFVLSGLAKAMRWMGR